MEQGVTLLLGGWIPIHPLNVEHLVNSVGEYGLDLRQEREPFVSPRTCILCVAVRRARFVVQKQGLFYQLAVKSTGQPHVLSQGKQGMESLLAPTLSHWAQVGRLLGDGRQRDFWPRKPTTPAQRVHFEAVAWFVLLRPNVQS